MDRLISERGTMAPSGASENPTKSVRFVLSISRRRPKVVKEVTNLALLIKTGAVVYLELNFVLPSVIC